MEKIFKHKHSIVIMLVLTLFMQIVGPVVSDFAYAEEGTQETVVEEIKELDLDPEQGKDPEDNIEELEEDKLLDDESEEKEPENQENMEKIEADEESEEDIIMPIMNLLNAGTKDLGNIFTLSSFKVNGSEADQNQVVTIGDGTTVTLDYTWNTEGKDAKAGDFAEIDVPDAFKLDRTFEDEPIIVEGINIGTYSLINNKIRFVFNEKIEEGTVKNGTLGFGVKFNEEKFQEDVVTEIEFNDTSNKTITIIGKPSGAISSINKKGLPDSNKDAKEITWTIDFGNPSGTEIANSKLTDVIPEGLELKEGSIKVYNLSVGLNGTVNQGSEFSVIPIIDGQNLEFNFDSIKPYKGYRVVYATTIEDYRKTQFTNEAALVYDTQNLPAEATVNVSDRSNLIEKGGEYNTADRSINWWIDVNKSGGSINEAIIEDTLPEGLTLTSDSIKIVKLTQSGSNWNESPSDKTASQFPVNLGKLESTDVYRIKFNTKIDYTKVNGGNYQKYNKFKNETVLKDGTREVGKADKTVSITRQSLLEKTGSAKVNYKDKEINWTVTVNKANHSIKNAIVTDIIPAGLTISESDIVIKNAAGTIVTDKTITVPANDGTNPTTITINLGDIDEKYTITYTTKITNFNISEFKNAVSLGGTGVGTGGTIPAIPVKPPNNSYLKEHKAIDYNEKTMDWKLTVDPRREAIKELAITDTFPKKGLILLEDTLVVKLGATTLIKGTDYTLTAIDGNYKNGFIIEFTGEKLPLNNIVTITYKTSYDPEKGIDPNTSEDGKYENKANFAGKTINGKTINVDRKASYTVRAESWNSGKKLGKLKSVGPTGGLVDGWISGNERKIEWQVYTNYLKQNLGTGVTITDTLAYEGEIDEDSIEIRTYTVASGGDTSLTSSKTGFFDLSRIRLLSSISQDNYSVGMDADKKGFKITFKEGFEVNERYVVTFTTSVADISLGKDIYKNKATLKVGGKEYPYTASIGFDKAENNVSKKVLNASGNKVYTDDEINWNIKINEALSIIQKDVKVVDTISKGMVYKNESLKVYKLEGTKRILVDPGSEKGYTLKTNNLNTGETVLTILFKDSIDSIYEIEYSTIVTAIEGKVNNKVDYSGKNLETTSKETTKLSASQFSYVGGDWDPLKGKIKVIKRDDKGNTIINLNAKFVLWYDLNEVDIKFGEAEFETKNGELEIGNLPLNRTYYLEEVEAPLGYELNSNRISVEVKKATGKDDINAYLVDFENKKIKTEITGTKEWVDGPTPRPTIELQLYRNSEALGDPVEIKDGTSSHTWKDLDKTDNAGVDYRYTIDELKVPENYGKSRSKNSLTIINTYDSPNTDVIGRKVWSGGSTPRPTIELQLYRNGEVLGSPVEIKDGTTSHTWKELDRTDKDGVIYKYTVGEVKVPVNYSKSISKDGLTVTNRYNDLKTEIDITGRKIWNGGPTPRPTIELQLYRNSEALGNPVELKDGTTSHTWKDLDKTDNAGVDYRYTIDEVKVPENYGKSRSENSLRITNTYDSPNTDVIGRKVWSGGSTPRPTIELQLYRNSEALGEPVEIKDGTTSHTWKDLDKTDNEGVDYRYTIDELKVPENYGKSRSENSLVITNTYDSLKTEVIGRKVWNGGPTPRPTIELQLYRNSEALGKPVEIKDGTSSHTWKDLDKTDNAGVDYRYTIDEVKVPENYGKSRSENSLTITNTYDSPNTDVIGRKVWNGGETPRPTIELQLYRNGVALGDSVELKDGTTSYTWRDLDKFDNAGIDYKYTIDEISVLSRYTKSISGDGLTVVNKYDTGGGGGGGGGDGPKDPVDPPREDPKDPKEPEVLEPTEPEEPGSQEPTDPEVLDPEEAEEPSIPIVLDPPSKGNVTFDEDGNWIYTPDPGATGKDSFIIIHPDGTEELIEIDLDDLPLGTVSVEDGQPILSKTESAKGEKPILPKTGDGNKVGFYLAGLMLIGLGVFLRKKTV